MTAAPLLDLGRAEAVVVAMLRAGRGPALAIGAVPMPAVAAVRVAVFSEAGGVQPPAWEGWLPEAEARELVQRHPGLRLAGWDAAWAEAWSVAWTEDALELVVWTAAGARLRVQEGTLDVLEQGRWTVVPRDRVARVSLARLPDEEGLLRLHTTDGRQLSMRAGRLAAAAQAGQQVAEVLGVEWSTSRLDR